MYIFHYTPFSENICKQRFTFINKNMRQKVIQFDEHNEINRLRFYGRLKLNTLNLSIYVIKSC